MPLTEQINASEEEEQVISFPTGVKHVAVKHQLPWKQQNSEASFRLRGAKDEEIVRKE